MYHLDNVQPIPQDLLAVLSTQNFKLKFKHTDCKYIYINRMGLSRGKH